MKPFLMKCSRILRPFKLSNHGISRMDLLTHLTNCTFGKKRSEILHCLNSNIVSCSVKYHIQWILHNCAICNPLILNFILLVSHCMPYISHAISKLSCHNFLYWSSVGVNTVIIEISVISMLKDRKRPVMTHYWPFPIF